MKFLTFKEFKKVTESDKYFNNRWIYFKEVIKLLEGIEFNNALELGPYKQPIIKGSDIMDRQAFTVNPKYVWDATKTPWPIEDKSYDMFLALQVWEHLGGKQKEAFNEVMRISKMAVLSFPYQWFCPGNCHHGIDKVKIREWTLYQNPERIIKVSNKIIYFFKFDK